MEKDLSGPPSAKFQMSSQTGTQLTFDSPQVNEDTKIIFQLTVSDGKPGGIGISTTSRRVDDFDTDPQPMTREKAMTRETAIL